MVAPQFYRPTDRGLEAQIAAKLARLRGANAEAADDAADQSA
jgi:hypothetical protein